jgi:hypothetical protein
MQPLMRPVDRASFKSAARTSLVPAGAATRPGLADVRDEELRRTILDRRMQTHLRTQWVDAIVAAMCSDILAARRHA